MEKMVKNANDEKAKELDSMKKNFLSKREQRAAKILKEFQDETDQLKVKHGIKDRDKIDEAIQEHMRNNPNQPIKEMEKDIAKIKKGLKPKVKVEGNILSAERFNKNMESINKRNAPANRLHHDAEREARKTRILAIAQWVDSKGNTPMTDKFREEVEEATNKAYEKYKREHAGDAEYNPTE